MLASGLASSATSSEVVASSSVGMSSADAVAAVWSVVMGESQLLITDVRVRSHKCARNPGRVPQARLRRLALRCSMKLSLDLCQIQTGGHIDFQRHVEFRRPLHHRHR